MTTAIRNNNNEYGTNNMRHHSYFSWIFLAFIAILGTVAIVSWFLYRPIAPYYWFPFGGFFFAIFWLFIIFGLGRWLFWGGRWGYHYPRRYYWRRYDSAFDILRERYARGEITKDQYDQMMRDLQDAA
jgi:putative membrane protein